jgi:putative hemolysin
MYLELRRLGLTLVLCWHVLSFAGTDSCALTLSETNIKSGMGRPILPAHLQVQIQELRSAHPEFELIKFNQFSVFFVPYENMGVLLLEIGRLREVEFRKVGEGTGKLYDIDRFDYNHHLFVWDNEASEIAGAYRIGFTAEIQQREGLHGLYTYKFIQFNSDFLRKLGPSLEMGRSFVSGKYQKSSVLQLMFMGIGEILYANPNLESLIGLPSISQDYGAKSKDLMVHFFMGHYEGDPELRFMVQPRSPYVLQSGASIEELNRILGEQKSIRKLSRYIQDLEKRESQGVPPLLGYYLDLIGGQVLSSNVDAEFNTVDLLIMVSTHRIPYRVVKFFLGDKRASKYKRTRAVPPSDL